MRRVFLSEKAILPLIEYLEESGSTVNIVREEPRLGPGVGAHPDLHMCKLGAGPDSGVAFACRDEFSPKYPQNAAYCAVVLDKYIIHRMDITAPSVLAFAKSAGLTPINVRQGYTKCGTVVVDGSSVITSDPGIFEALKRHPDIDALLISGGSVALPGFDRGFLGGASGRVGDEIVFNGDLSRHPDFEKIRSFIADRGLRVKYFLGYELCDVGSVIEADII